MKGTAVKKLFAATALVAIILASGCQQPTPTTAAPPPPSPENEKDTNIKIRGPRGGGVDLNTNGKTGDTNVDVDIRRKDTRR
jgi:hypothetical protein